MKTFALFQQNNIKVHVLKMAHNLGVNVLLV